MQRGKPTFYKLPSLIGCVPLLGTGWKAENSVRRLWWRSREIYIYLYIDIYTHTHTHTTLFVNDASIDLRKKSKSLKFGLQPLSPPHPQKGSRESNKEFDNLLGLKKQRLKFRIYKATGIYGAEILAKREQISDPQHLTAFHLGICSDLISS